MSIAARRDDRMTRIVTRDRSLNEQRREADKALEVSAELCRIAEIFLEHQTYMLGRGSRIDCVAEEENSARPGAPCRFGDHGITDAFADF